MQSVRIATWNCAGHLAKKWAALDALAADLMIVQECGPDSPQLAQEHGWQALWTGDGPKGLALFARPGWTLEELPHDEQWWLSARVLGPIIFTLVGFWALTPKLAQKSYTGQATMAAERLGEIPGPVVFGGDFNASDHPAHLRLMTAMAGQGRPSTYHRDRQCGRNEEPESTYFHLWKLELPWHIDLLFAPAERHVESVEVRAFADYAETRLSDHVPVIATLSV